jgi:hypothetical protein
MMRIVTSHYRYKRTAKRRRKGAMISEPSAIVTATRSAGTPPTAISGIGCRPRGGRAAG